jgi:hypothetical protein
VPAHLFLGHRSLLSLPPFVLNVDPGAKSGQAESGPRWPKFARHFVAGRALVSNKIGLILERRDPHDLLFQACWNTTAPSRSDAHRGGTCEGCWPETRISSLEAAAAVTGGTEWFRRTFR